MWFPSDDRYGVTPLVRRDKGWREFGDFEANVLRDRLGSGALFVDVGAHVGWFSRMAVSLGARVVACEPHPVLYGLLQANLEGTNATTHRVAVGDRAGVGALLPSADNSGDHQLQRHPGFQRREPCPGEHRDAIPVQIRTLDGLLAGMCPALVKVDVQGAEPLVLAGARDTIARCRPWLLVEYAPLLLDDPAGFLAECRAIGTVTAYPDVDLESLPHGAYVMLLIVPDSHRACF